MHSDNWNIDKSDELYSLKLWGAPYFSINSTGHLVVSPQGERGGSIDLYDLVKALKGRGLALPILLRFPDILQGLLPYPSQLNIQYHALQHGDEILHFPQPGHVLLPM